MSAMLGDFGDSFSTTTRVIVPDAAMCGASAVFEGSCSFEASEASSGVETFGRRGLLDFSGINSPMTTVEGVPEATAVMRFPRKDFSGFFENSPVSVLQGPGDDAYTPSPVSFEASAREDGNAMADLNSFLNSASSRNSEVGISGAAQSDDSDAAQSFRLPLLKIRTARRPPLASLLSEESCGGSWNGRFRRLERHRSSSESIICSRGEEGGEAEGQVSDEVDLKTPGETGKLRRLERHKDCGDSIVSCREGGEVGGQVTEEAELKTVDENEEPESPTTPCSAPRPHVLECPDAPCGSRSKELNRQSSLNDTKLLMTTHLKRSASIFRFDKHFEFLREIGRGSFSTVYEARDRRSGLHCAVKMSRRQFRGRDDREHYLREIQSVACLSEHANVVKYFRSWQQASHFYIQMELCECGSLRDLIDASENDLPETQVWNFIHQVASGLEHIHSQGILHLDIKPENIFVDGQGVLKIGDFGLAVPCRLWEWEEGDGAYVAPELLREEEPGTGADMYSFGAMAYEWATRSKLPRSGPLREGRIKLPESRSKALEDLVRALLNPIPAKRPTAAEVISWKRDE